MTYRERRKYRRLIDKNIVLVTLLSVPDHKEMEGRTFTCTTADISAGGVRLMTSTKIPVGTVMELRVAAVSPPAAFRHVGRVSWVLDVLSPPASFVGIEFTTQDLKTNQAWQTFVDKKTPHPLSADDINAAG